MKTWHKIVIGDSRNMGQITDESVHLIITSPPYWQLKDYGSRKQIGFNDTYGEYINNLNLVWNECHRILHKGCRLCINIGDQFARNVDFFIKIGDNYVGLQIKPAGDISHIPQIFKEYSIQKITHKKFTAKYGGKVFYVISIKEGEKKENT